MSTVKGPAPRPCSSCPYRKDVPSGIWAASEYAKLPEYDRQTGEQPTSPFMCHQHDRDSDRAQVCSGWAGCHGKTHETELLALRLAEALGTLPPEAVEATINYESPVPLFDSGQAAADHGVRDIENPGPDAIELLRKVAARREDVTYG